MYIQLPMTINIDGYAMLIEFDTDTSVTEQGFRLTYHVSDTPVESIPDSNQGSGRCMLYL